MRISLADVVTIETVCANVGAIRLVGLSSSLMSARHEEIKQTNRLLVDLENVRSATTEALNELISQLDAPDLSARLH